MDLQKIALILSVGAPKNTKELVSFDLGLGNSYRCYIKGFTTKIKPLRHLLTKTCLNYEWTKECEKAFYTFQTTFT